MPKRLPASLVEMRRVRDLQPYIGKEIEVYDAIDTGMFLCSPTVFDDLERASKDGNCSLSDGMRRLAAQIQPEASRPSRPAAGS